MTRMREVKRAGSVSLMLAGLMAAAGCGNGLRLRSTHISFDQFVNATVALRRAAAETDNPALFQQRKREIERKLGVSDSDLREFSRVHSSDVTVLSAAWDSIEARLDRPATPPKPMPPGVPDAAGQAPKPGARDVVTPGALPGGLPAVTRIDSLTPPPEDSLLPPAPPLRPPKPVNEHKPFY